MGMLLIPNYLLAGGVFLFAVIRATPLVRVGHFALRDWLLGAGLPVLTLVVLLLVWKFQGRLYTMQPYLALPFWMLYLPGLVLLASRKYLELEWPWLWWSMVFAGLLLVVVFWKMKALFQWLEVELYY